MPATSEHELVYQVPSWTWELGHHLDVCLTGLGKLKRRYGGSMMVYFYRALFFHCDQLVQWFLTWENYLEKRSMVVYPNKHLSLWTLPCSSVLVWH